jgi:tripartite ATP-independent transporter DctM subunit
MITQTLIILIGFVVLFVVGVPISISLGLASLFSLVLAVPFDTAVLILSQKMFLGVNSFALLAIPCFVLAGNMMAHGGMAGQLINLARMIVGRMPGALLQVNILGNMLFGCISGSAVASAAAIGGIINEEERKDGYDMDLAAAANIASCPAGLLIPPSNTLIIFSLVSGGTSVGALFIAGYLPGLVMGGVSMLTAYLMACRNKGASCPVSHYVVSRKEKMIILRDAIPLLVLIFVIIIGIIKGVFTATEGAAITIAYVFIVGVFFLKTLKKEQFIPIMIGTLRSSCMILFLIACSGVLSWVITFYQMPVRLSESILSVTENKVLLLLLINLVLLLVGIFMDMSPAILIFTPLLLPVATSIGIHPVHFGIIMNANLAIGLCTPPVGSALFVGCAVAKRTIETVTPKIIPFFFALLIGLLIISFVPALSLTLPRLMGLI